MHAAIRLVLPLLPALAASSPIVDGKVTGILDNRLVVYRAIRADPVDHGPGRARARVHARRLRGALLGRSTRDVAPYDPEGMLRHEWCNARGAIARFDRMAIEIRVLDVQETPLMDVAYAALIVEVLKFFVPRNGWAERRSLDRWHESELGKLLTLAERQGEDAGHQRPAYLARVRLRGSSTDLKGLWEHLIEAVSARGRWTSRPGRLLEHYLRHGTLATRSRKRPASCRRTRR